MSARRRKQVIIVLICRLAGSRFVTEFRRSLVTFKSANEPWNDNIANVVTASALRRRKTYNDDAPNVINWSTKAERTVQL